MKDQQIFDKVAIHLYNQGMRSVGASSCKYYGENGLKCAAGVLISADFYFPELEEGNRTIKYIVNEHKDKFPEWFVENIELIQDLQSVHDKTYHWESEKNMHDALVDVAIKYNLSPDVLKNLSFVKKEEKTDE